MSFLSHTNRAYFLAGLLIPTSHALFGNLGVLAMSTMRDTERTTPIQRVKAWQRFYSVGALHLMLPTVATIPVFGLLAYKARGPLAFRWAVAGLISSISVVPWTAYFLVSINKQLNGIANKDDEAAATSRGDRLIEQWVARHWFRIAAYTVSWTSTVALLAFV